MFRGVWALVYTAKVRRSTTPAPTVNLAEIDRGEKLLPVLAVLQSPADRDFAAKRIFDTLADHDGALPNTGAIARIRIPRADLIGNNQLEELRKRAEDAKGSTISLFTPAEFAQIKPQIAVRGINVFRRDFLIWAGAILAAFLLTHIVWVMRGFSGPWAFLPLLLILTGIGYALMVGLRDPLRDTLIFVPFAQGVAGGCIVMLIASLIDWDEATACLQLCAAAGRDCAFDRADLSRQRPGGKRCAREPRPIPAGGSDQSSAGVFPGGIFREALAAAAGIAREAVHSSPE